jgi:hypothetical protein
VSVAPPLGEVAPGATAVVTVTVTNTGTEVVEGDLSRVPAITVADGDVVAWHSSGTSDAGAMHVALQPGDVVTLTGALSALRCTAADDDGTGLPPDLPPLAPGPYTMNATVAFSTPAEGMVLLPSSRSCRCRSADRPNARTFTVGPPRGRGRGIRLPHRLGMVRWDRGKALVHGVGTSQVRSSGIIAGAMLTIGTVSAAWARIRSQFGRARSSTRSARLERPAR